MRIKALIFGVSLWIGLGNNLHGQSEIEFSKLCIGEEISFQSDILGGETRQVNIYLPAEYHSDSTTRYPVIYLLDGGMDEDFLHIAGIVQFGNFPWIDMIPQSIVVGIVNDDRKRDFTYPSKDTLDQIDFPTSGGSNEFIDFLQKELRSVIEKKYRTTSGTTLIGQSLGGLLATEILLTQPQTFDRYIIVSPSLWWDQGSLLSCDLKDISGVEAVYIAVGNEGEIMISAAEKLYSKLQKSDLGNEELEFQFYEDKNHGDVLHIAAYEAFEWLNRNKEEKK